MRRVEGMKKYLFQSNLVLASGELRVISKSACLQYCLVYFDVCSNCSLIIVQILKTY